MTEKTGYNFYSGIVHIRKLISLAKTCITNVTFLQLSMLLSSLLSKNKLEILCYCNSLPH